MFGKIPFSPSNTVHTSSFQIFPIVDFQVFFNDFTFKTLLTDFIL